MKTIFLIALILTPLLFIQATTKGSQYSHEGITFFEGTWDEALALAKKENKLIFLDAYASWCGPCKRMKKNIFSAAKVGDFFNANFINIKIDMEKGEGPALARKYDVRAYPTLFFINHSGKIKQAVVGYHNENQLIELGESVL